VEQQKVISLLNYIYQGGDSMKKVIFAAASSIFPYVLDAILTLIGIEE